MGIFDFVKNAGRKLGLGDEEEKAPAASGPQPTVDPAALEALRERQRAKALQKVVSDLGLNAAEVQIAMSGEVVRLTGKVDSQEEREKIVLAVGNIHGVSQVDDGLEVETAEAEANFYTVVSGDTLGKIAKEAYGNAGKYPVIFEANKPMLTDPNKIYPGQVLRIPALDE
jgi:nucleoid-associated protein YgaU